MNKYKECQGSVLILWDNKTQTGNALMMKGLSNQAEILIILSIKIRKKIYWFIELKYENAKLNILYPNTNYMNMLSIELHFLCLVEILKISVSKGLESLTFYRKWNYNACNDKMRKIEHTDKSMTINCVITTTTFIVLTVAPTAYKSCNNLIDTYNYLHTALAAKTITTVLLLGVGIRSDRNKGTLINCFEDNQEWVWYISAVGGVQK